MCCNYEKKNANIDYPSQNDVVQKKQSQTILTPWNPENKENVKENVKNVQQEYQNVNLEVLQENFDDLEAALKKITFKYYEEFENEMRQMDEELSNAEKDSIFQYFQSLQTQNDQSKDQNRYNAILGFIRTKKKKKEELDLLSNIQENILNPTSFEVMKTVIVRCKDELKVEILKYESQQIVKKFIKDNRLEGKVYNNIPWYFGGNEDNQTQIEELLLKLVEEKSINALLYLKFKMAPNTYQKAQDLFNQTIEPVEIQQLAQSLYEKFISIFEMFQNQQQQQQENEGVSDEMLGVVNEIQEQDKKGNELLLDEVLNMDVSDQMQFQKTSESFRNILNQYNLMQENKIHDGQIEVWYKLCLYFLTQHNYHIVLSILNIMQNLDFSKSRYLIAFIIFTIQEVMMALDGSENFLCDEKQQEMLVKITKFIKQQYHQQVVLDHQKCFYEIQKIKIIKMAQFIFKYNVQEDNEEFIKSLINFCKQFELENLKAKGYQQSIDALLQQNNDKRMSKVYYQQCAIAISKNQYQRALSSGLQCLEIRKKLNIKDGVKDKDYQQIVYRLQQIQIYLKNDQEALKYSEDLRECIESQEGLFKNTDNYKGYLEKINRLYGVMYELNSNIKSYIKMGFFQEKRLKIYQQLYKLEQNKESVYLNSNLQEQVNCCILISTSYFNQNKYKDCISICKKGNQIAKNQKSIESSKKIAQLYHQMALCFEQLNKPADSRDYAKKAFQIRKEELGFSSIDTLDSWMMFCEGSRRANWFLGSIMSEYEQLNEQVGKLANSARKRNLLIQLKVSHCYCLNRYGNNIRALVVAKEALEMIKSRNGVGSEEYQTITQFVTKLQAKLR